MEQAFILMVAGVTSVGLCFLGVKGFRCPAHKLWHAITRAGECLGLMIVFALLNLAVGMGAVLSVRWITGWFVSLYVVSDVTLVILSAFQALIFHAWREVSGYDHPSGAGASDLLQREP